MLTAVLDYIDQPTISRGQTFPPSACCPSTGSLWEFHPSPRASLLIAVQRGSLGRLSVDRRLANVVTLSLNGSLKRQRRKRQPEWQPEAQAKNQYCRRDVTRQRCFSAFIGEVIGP